MTIMQKITLFCCTTAIAITVVFANCKKEKPLGPTTSGPDPANGNFISYTIDGATYTTSYNSTYTKNDSKIIESRYCYPDGFFKSFHFIIKNHYGAQRLYLSFPPRVGLIKLKNFYTIGYVPDSSNFNLTYQSIPTDSSINILNISALDTVNHFFSGTFTGKMYKTGDPHNPFKNITGSFNMPYMLTR